MGVLKWLLRCIPGLSILLLLILLECALKIAQTEWISFTYPPFLVDQPLPLIAQSIFIVYTLLLHILVLVFPVRLCYSVWTAASQIKSAHGIGAEAAATNSQHDSISHSLLDLELREHSTGEYCDVTMAVIIPSYKEDIGTLEDTLRVLASHDRAKSSYDVCCFNVKPRVVERRRSLNLAGFPGHGRERPDRYEDGAISGRGVWKELSKHSAHDAPCKPARGDTGQK